MCHDLLRDARLYCHLLRIDEDLAAKAQAAGCPRCRGRLDAGSYPRKPRGVEASVGPGYDRRFSFCCDVCRRRVTPPSVRFFGRRVYLAPVFVIISAMTGGFAAGKLARLKEMFGVDRRTVIRWRRWWRDRFPTTSFWRALRGRVLPPVDEDDLPSALLPRFGPPGQEQLALTLTFLSPLTTSSLMAI